MYLYVCDWVTGDRARILLPSVMKAELERAAIGGEGPQKVCCATVSTCPLGEKISSDRWLELMYNLGTVRLI